MLFPTVIETFFWLGVQVCFKFAIFLMMCVCVCVLFS